MVSILTDTYRSVSNIRDGGAIWTQCWQKHTKKTHNACSSSNEDEAVENPPTTTIEEFGVGIRLIIIDLALQ